MGKSPESNYQTDVGANASAPVLLLRLKKKTRGRFELLRTRLTLGRASDSDIVLDDSSGVSRNHAHILVVDDEVVVEDLGSRNGTFVNGKLTTRRTLRPGDRIAIGHYRLHFIHETAPAQEHKAPKNEITELFRLWGPAAVPSDQIGCPLCNAFVVDFDTQPESETGEYVRIDEKCSEWFADPAHDSESHESDIDVRPGEFDDENFPHVSVVSDTIATTESEEELLARVERLVGLAGTSDDDPPDDPAQDDGDEQTHAELSDDGDSTGELEAAPVPDGHVEPKSGLEDEDHGENGHHDARSKLMSRKTTRRREIPARRKLARQSRLGHRQKSPPV